MFSHKWLNLTVPLGLFCAFGLILMVGSRRVV